MLILLQAQAQRHQPCAVRDHALRDGLRPGVHLQACQPVVRDADDALLREGRRFQQAIRR
jgi:hypothetical protein